MNKYRNRKVKRNGESYDSIKEANRHGVLKLMERAGKIRDLRRQVKYELIPAQYENRFADKNDKKARGKCVERPCVYVADFVYYIIGGDEDEFVVEDCKGFKTEVYKIKKKLMLCNYGIRIKET